MKTKKVRKISGTVTEEYLDKRLKLTEAHLDIKLRESFDKHEEQHKKG